MMRVIFILFVLAFCNASRALSSSTDEHKLRSELKKLRQLSGNLDIQLPSRSPAFPRNQLSPLVVPTTDEISLTQSAPSRKLSPEDQELMQLDLQQLEEQSSQKNERPAGTPLYRGR